MTLLRIYHPYSKWECYKAGFFSAPKNKEQNRIDRENYAALLKNIPEFERVLDLVLTEWPNSCEHNLTNETMNRIAWLGQASCAYAFGCSAEHTRGAFVTLTVEEQKLANQTAAKYLNKWLEREGYNECLKKVS